MRRFFADTFYWIALTVPKDVAHRQVMEFTVRLEARSVVTTDEVLSEFLTFCAHDPRLRTEAGVTVTELLNGIDIRVIPQSRKSFQDGLALYNARPDKGYSLTDCISMATMRREGLIDALTNDRHFEQEGFRALFRQ